MLRIFLILALALVPAVAQEAQRAKAEIEGSWEKVSEFRRAGGQDGDEGHPGVAEADRLWALRSSFEGREARAMLAAEAVHLLVHARRYDLIEGKLEQLEMDAPAWERMMGPLAEAAERPRGLPLAVRVLGRLAEEGAGEMRPKALLRLASVYVKAGEPERFESCKRRVLEQYPESVAAERFRRLERSRDVKAGEEIPNLTLTSIAGKEIALKDLRGKLVLIDFWSTTCGPCLAAMPTLKRLHERFGKEGLVTLGVAFDSSAEKVRRTADEHQASWPQILGRDSQGLAGALGVQGAPSYVLIDAQGRLVAANMAVGYLEGKIKKLLPQAM